MAGSADVFVITGAGGDMGRACISEFAGQGPLLLTDVNERALQRALDAASAVTNSVTPMRCDLTKSADVAQLADAVGYAGRFRALVHTAGISPQMADGRTVLRVDLVGTARVLAALEPLVGPGTAAVCVASIAGYSDLDTEVNGLLDDPLASGFLDDVEAALGHDLDSDTGYVLAKRGVMRLCERLAAPWGTRGGRIVSIAPGLIDTDMGRLELANQEIMQTMSDITPVKRPGTGRLPGRVEDIAAVAGFLCSERGSFISGCDIRIDGGLVGAGRHMGLAG